MTDLAQAMPTTLPTQSNTQSLGVFQVNSFNDAVNVANFLSNSSLVPTDYRRWVVRKNQYGKPVIENGVTQYDENPNATSNCLIALNMANRMGYDPLMIMQNLYLIEGRPAWSSQFIIAAINACGKFAPLNFEMQNHGLVDAEYTVTNWEDGKKQVTPVAVQIENLSCVAWTTDRKGNRLESSKVDMLLAIKEGWYGKNGSKWQTMPEQMLRYRAAAFFGRIYAPEILMGISTADEIPDFIDVTPVQIVQASKPQMPCYNIEPVKKAIANMQTLDDCKEITDDIAGLKAKHENGEINLCGDDLQTLRNAYKSKNTEIKDRLEQAAQAEKPQLDTATQLVSEITKLINATTLVDADLTRKSLCDSKAEIGEVTFAMLDEVLDKKLNDLNDEAESGFCSSVSSV